MGLCRHRSPVFWQKPVAQTPGGVVPCRCRSVLFCRRPAARTGPVVLPARHSRTGAPAAPLGRPRHRPHPLPGQGQAATALPAPAGLEAGPSLPGRPPGEGARPPGRGVWGAHGAKTPNHIHIHSCHPSFLRPHRGCLGLFGKAVVSRCCIDCGRHTAATACYLHAEAARAPEDSWSER